MASSGSDVPSLLARLRDSPIDNAGASDGVLGTLYNYLMEVPTNPSDNAVHWFCPHAAPNTVAAATFLIRLFAYSSQQVENWKVKLHSCLSRCSECVRWFEQVKVSSRNTYFGAFQEDVLQNFYKTFEQWELEMVIQDLTNANVLGQQPTKTLSDVHPAVVYRLVCNWTIFNDQRILSAIQASSITHPLPGWPSDPLSPGMFILLMSDSPSVGQWAKNQASKCTTVPMSSDMFVGPYLQATELVVHALTLSGTDRLPDSALSSFSFANDPSRLWSGFSSLLRHLPVDQLASDTRQHTILRRIITGHLHDTGPQFIDILRCLQLLLKRTDEKFWVGEGPEFPQVVFDSVKDNPSFTRLLQNTDSHSERPWHLSWFGEYLHTIRNLPAYGEVLVRMVDFLCEETQHERFQDARPSIMASALHLLSAVLRKCSADDFPHRTSLFSAIDIHGETFLGIAFSRSYDVDKWRVTRSSARAFLKNLLQIDIQSVKATIMRLCEIFSHKKDSRPVGEIPKLSVRKQMWKKLYPAIQTNDADGVAAIIAIVAQSAHMDVLHAKPFAPVFEISGVEDCFQEVNRSLVTIREGFLGAMTHYADFNTSSSALDVLRRLGVVQDILKLMLSPVEEEVQRAAQNVVELAFDVEGRHDCFRALLENLPDAGLEGIFDFLTTFTEYAPLIPEACSLSKSLVRCFTDIIDVLCTTPNGLLHSPRFLRPTDDKGPATQLPKLWSLMAKSLTVIFKRTPLWSTYFDSGEMIVWMRDALIFGREMLATWKVVESAANSRLTTAATVSKKLSSIGRKMMGDLQGVLQELARWLRLTDEELLHQSFSLLKSLLECFQEAGITPSEDAMKKLRKLIDSPRTDEPDKRIRLDKSKLLTLEAALDEFDDVIVVSHPAPLVKESTKAHTRPLQKNVQKPALSKFSSKPVIDLPTSKPSKSRFFTEEDRQKLDAAVSLPSFRRAANLPVGAKSGASTSAQPAQVDSKTEGLAKPASSESSSSDESDSEEEGANEGLAALAKLQRSPKIRKMTERRQVKTLDILTQQNPMQERIKRKNEARNAALRLHPDISNLHKALLSWDFEHTGSEPPGDKPKLTQIPNKFTNFEEYRAVFEPLLLMECWAQILQAKEEAQDLYECQINSRQFLDHWLDLDISLLGSVKKDWYLAETDVILLRHPGAKKCIMTKTQSYRLTPQGAQASIRCYIRPGSIDPGLQIGTKWQLSKLFSLSTLHREYAALVSVAYYDLFETILNPRLSKPPRVERRDVEKTIAKYNVNEPQANAILSSLQTEGFVLIQGPPGTGKTSTICGLIAASLSNQRPPPVLVQAGRNAIPLEKKSSKILLCAPSNAAIDEIASRISMGFRGSGGGLGNIKVVRLGAKNAMNISVQDISLDTLVDKKLESDPNKLKADSKDILMEISALRRDIDSVKQTMAQKRQEESTVHDNLARKQVLNDEISQLRSRKMSMSKQLDNLIDKNRSETRTLDALRRKTRIEVVHEADVVCSTLSGAGHELLAQFDFDMVIIDEAAQAIELSSLIPLKYRINRCVMVGDPQQLPPTVLSREACLFRYNESLFVRLQKQRPDAVHLLSIQYRMHPDISRLPSRIFYQGRLQDGPGMEKKTGQPWHTDAKFGTYRFFSVTRGLEEASGRSIKNMAECQVAVALYSRLRQEFSSVGLSVGVVSMYKAQVMEMRRQFEQRFGRDIVESVDFNTVDGFQGQEKDVIILSCVRAGPGLQSVGFLSDIRRMNVALTRAKSSLFILGHAPTLERSDATWKDIVHDARSRSALFDTDATYFTRPTANQPPPLRLPTKEAKTVTPVSVPSDLVTPRDFKSNMTQNTESKPLQAISDHKPPMPVSASFSGVGVKRPAEDGDDHPPRPPPQPVEEPPKPRVPPAKRPKQPPNIFIPKSNKKVNS